MGAHDQGLGLMVNSARTATCSALVHLTLDSAANSERVVSSNNQIHFGSTPRRQIYIKETSQKKILLRGLRTELFDERAGKAVCACNLRGLLI